MGKFSFAIITSTERKLPFYLVGAGVDFHQEMDPHDRPGGYPYWQWIQCEEGEGTLTLEGAEHKVGPGQAMFLYPGVPHRYQANAQPWKVHWFTFGGKQVSPVLETIGLKSSGVYATSDADLLVSRIRSAFALLVSGDSLKGVECSSLVYDFLISLMKHAYRSGEGSFAGRYRKLEAAFEIIRSRYYRVISLEELAAAVGVSPQHLCHLFRKALNLRPVEYLNHYRINRSKDLMIREPQISIQEVARRCGFESLSYFGTVFRKIERLSPGQYRRLHLPTVKRYSEESSTAAHP
jgi:AraC-like DNA-binding protein